MAKVKALPAHAFGRLRSPAFRCGDGSQSASGEELRRIAVFVAYENLSNKRSQHMGTSNHLSGNGPTLFNQLGWFIVLNSAWLLLAALTVWLGSRSYTISMSGSVADGTVVRLWEDGVAFDSDFAPIVEFQVDGKTYRVQSQNTYRWWNRYTRFPVGGQVAVRYETSNPENAEINSWWDIWNETIILGVFTLFAAIVINVYLLFRWRSRRARGVGTSSVLTALAYGASVGHLWASSVREVYWVT
jgi:hypothetical protein